MRKSASPRPSFDAPTRIPWDGADRYLWGDETSGFAADWVFVSSEKIHMLVFALPEGTGFRHSEAKRTLFGADEVFYVLDGALVLANPEHGEVHRLDAGDVAFFRRDTWHHGFGHAPGTTHVLEFFAPPPRAGTASEYAWTRPLLEESRYRDDRYEGRWPMASAERHDTASIRVLGPSDVLWRLEGDENQILVGLHASTEHLTAGRVEILPGKRSDVHAHGGDEALLVLEGELGVHLPESAPNWFTLGPRDGFYIPDGVPHRYLALSAEPVSFVFGVAPTY